MTPIEYKLYEALMLAQYAGWAKEDYEYFSKEKKHHLVEEFYHNLSKQETT